MTWLDVHEHPRDAKQSIVSGFKIKIAPVHSDFDVAFFPLSLMTPGVREVVAFSQM